MVTQIDDWARLAGAGISFHEALRTILSVIKAEPVGSKSVHCLSAQHAEQLRKAASTIETILGSEPPGCGLSQTALDLLRTLVHDLS